jgi:ferredoxin
MLDFNTIKRHFPEDEWDIGYLDHYQFKRVLNAPIKATLIPKMESVHLTQERMFEDKIVCGLVFAKKSQAWDYTLYDESEEIFASIPEVKNLDFLWYTATINYKEAELSAGMGVRGKNTLIYNYKFGFQHRITCLALSVDIVNFPEKRKFNPANKRGDLWPNCTGCWDCVNACPVGAIHAQEGEEPFWFDYKACSDFLNWGNHEKIPSFKHFIRDHIYPQITDEDLGKMVDDKSGQQFNRKYGMRSGFGIGMDGKYGVEFDGNVTRIDGQPVYVPFCRECTSQPRCSAFGGEYPYEKYIKEAKELAEERRSERNVKRMEKLLNKRREFENKND